MTVTRAWKVYGEKGEPQKASFEPSKKYDWIGYEVINSDVTGTNDYSIVKVEEKGYSECANFLLIILKAHFNNEHGKIEEICMGSLINFCDQAHYETMEDE